jgi:protein involved in polysaccharide export with SLBB domain
MKKLFTLIIVCFAIIQMQAQNLSALTAGTNAGALVSSSATSAMRQLTQLYSTSKASNNTSGTAAKAAAPNLSQLQLLGIDPSNIAKFYKDNAASNNGEDGGLQSLLSEISDLRTRQEYMQSMLDSANSKQEVSPTTPNEIFGHDFFSSGKLALFIKSSDNKAPDSYVLDAGDELNIAVWGNADYNNNFTVSSDGYIQIPEFGRIYVKGLTFGAVKSQIGKRLATFINPANTKYEITLNYARTIEVNIVGEVKLPGTYQIPAINSIYNAVNAANGITDIGSVRDIQVRREGKTIKRFDVYEFLFNPLSTQNFYLQKGDFIYVSTQNKLIKITGAVRRAAKYELLKGENLNELIGFAGGLSADAYVKSFQITRTTGNTTQIIDVNYEDILNNNSNYTLIDGDVVNVTTIPGGIENFVNINGLVRFPGKYELKEGFRITDIIKIAGGIRTDAYLDRAYLKRKLNDNTFLNQKFSLKNIILDEANADNYLLQKGDAIEIFSKENFIEKFVVSIDGSVLKPTVMEFTDGMTLNDLLFYAGGFKKEAASSKIEISRVMDISSNPDMKFKPQHIVVDTFQVGPNLELDEKSKQFQLAPLDKVYVRKIYGFDLQMNVVLNGEVKYPGIYPILHKNETVLDLIERAGGLTPYAYIEDTKLTRPDRNLPKTIFQLKDAFKDPKSRANYILKEGDIIDIPTINQLVSIRGAVGYPGLDSTETINGKFIPGKTARWYIRHYAAGFKGAKKKTTLVIYPNRKVEYTHSFIGIKRYPVVDNEGALITVDKKIKKPRPPKGPEAALNWNIILPSVIAALTSVASTLTLIFVLKK